MKKNNMDNMSSDEINEKLEKLKAKEEDCSFLAKLIFSTSLSFAVIIMLINSIVPLSYLLGVGAFSLGGLVSLGFVVKGNKCVEEIDKLKEEKKTVVEQLAMEDVLKESYKPELVKKGKSKSVEKENKNDLNL